MFAEVRSAVHDTMANGDGRCVRDFAESGENVGEGLGLRFEEVIAMD